MTIEILDIDRVKKQALNSGNYDQYIEDEIINKINELIVASNSVSNYSG